MVRNRGTRARPRAVKCYCSEACTGLCRPPKSANEFLTGPGTYKTSFWITRMSVDAADSRLCSQCVKSKPITDFRRRSRDGTDRLSQCRDCHNQAEANRRSAKRANQINRRTAQCLRQISDERDNARLQLLTGVMMQQVGGVEGLFSDWVDFHIRAMESRGYAAAFRSFEALGRMLLYCEQTRPKPDDMELEDLEGELSARLTRAIQQNPKIAVDDLRELGWTVIPPGTSP